MSKPMYGLFKNTYDYYEWNDLVCVSDDKSKLEEYYNNNCSDRAPLITEEEYDHYSGGEKVHYIIEEVKYV